MAQQVLYQTANGHILQWQDTEAFAYAAAPAGTAVLGVTEDQWAAQTGAFYVSAGALTAGTAPALGLSLAQQAQAAIAAGLAVTSTATPALSATYACDDAAQARFSRMFDLIQRAGGAAFPADLTSLPWPDITGTVHTFDAVTDFLNLETAVGNYVLALDLIVVTNSGSLPAATVTIA